jgi:hypothetical protein
MVVDIIDYLADILWLWKVSGCSQGNCPIPFGRASEWTLARPESSYPDGNPRFLQWRGQEDSFLDPEMFAVVTEWFARP